MPEYSNDALGQVVREERARAGLTQEKLGKDAGYRTGAGVSISRLENGLLRPSAERFAGVARALGLQPEDLEARACDRTREDTEAGAPTRGQGNLTGIDTQAEGAATARGALSLKARARELQQEIDLRTSVITDLTEAFNKQHDRARDEFFVPFVEIAERVEGAPPPKATDLDGDDDGPDPDPEAVAA